MPTARCWAPDSRGQRQTRTGFLVACPLPGGWKRATGGTRPHLFAAGTTQCRQSCLYGRNVLHRDRARRVPTVQCTPRPAAAAVSPCRHPTDAPNRFVALLSAMWAAATQGASLLGRARPGLRVVGRRAQGGVRHHAIPLTTAATCHPSAPRRVAALGRAALVSAKAAATDEAPEAAPEVAFGAPKLSIEVYPDQYEEQLEEKVLPKNPS